MNKDQVRKELIFTMKLVLSRIAGRTSSLGSNPLFDHGDFENFERIIDDVFDLLPEDYGSGSHPLEGEGPEYP